ncbi:hypothetical protein A5630_15625 [Mycolicibacterium mucogenicum]|uniref:HTH hxlR-type domain-containing protein n=2 Tax=Mycolicibacterium mucogenicum TaxID=56689 RepID=A0A1A3HB41_MYCMU|nr:hypothetical protein A5630_15625 [Mycolicibacterium mucogenicum]
MAGSRRFNEIHRSMPTLSRTMLSTRLRHLERIGVLCRRPIPHTAHHGYALTLAGQSLRRVLEELGEWTRQWQLEASNDTDVPLLLWRLLESIDRDAIPNGKVCIEFQFSGGAHPRGWLHVDPVRSAACIGDDEDDVDLVVRTKPDVLNDLWRGRRSCRTTVERGDIAFTGPPQLVRGFSNWFRPVGDTRPMSLGAM